MADPYKYQDDVTYPSRKSADITPNDTTVFEVTKAVYVGGAGDLVCHLVGDGGNRTFKNVPAGAILDIRIDKVLTTSSASYLVGLY